MYAALVSGTVTCLITNPLWLVKTRIQAQDTRALEYSNTWGAFSAIHREEGLRGFYRGLVPSLWGVSHITLQFPLYESLKQMLAEARSLPLCQS